MHQVEQKMIQWIRQNKKLSIATLVKVYGAAPQPLGSRMVITEDLDFIGSVSGGCVESDVIEQSKQVIQSSQPKLLKYGISNDTAWDVGLACGGAIEVFIEPLSHLHEKAFELQSRKKLFAMLTILNGRHIGEKQIILPVNIETKEKKGWINDPTCFDFVSKAIQNQKSEVFECRLDEEDCWIFCEVYSPPARLIIIGGVHIALPLVEFARVLDFITIILDARETFANRDRFPLADQIIVGWPADELVKLNIDENTFLAFITHDDKFDIPALQIALPSKARYIGILGSKKTHSERVQKLLELGISPDLLSRLHAPIGLDIGATGAQEIALAIISQMIAIRNGKNLPGKA